MTVTTPAILATKRISCSTTTRACAWASSCSNAATRSISVSSIPAVGSSSSTNAGSCINTIANSTSCRCPWANVPTRRCARSPISRRARASAIAPSSALPRRRRCPATQRESRTVSPSNTDGTCIFRPTPARAMAIVPLPAISRPAKRILPASGVSCPVRHLKNVLLPAPLGPIRQRSSLARSVKAKPSSAATPPKCLLKSLTTSTASPLIALDPV